MMTRTAPAPTAPPGDGLTPAQRLDAWLAGREGDARRLFPKDLAHILGVSPKTVHKYNSAAKGNRAAGTPEPGDLPAPDGHEQTRHGPPSPWWRPETLREWITARQPMGWPREPGPPVERGQRRRPATTA